MINIIKRNILMPAMIALAIPALASAEPSVNIDGKDIAVEQISKKMVVMKDGSLVFHTEDKQIGVVFPNGAVRFLIDEDKIETAEGKTRIIGRKRPYVIAAIPQVYKANKTEVVALSPRSLCRDADIASLPGMCAPGKQFILAERCIKTKGERNVICLKNEIDS